MHGFKYFIKESGEGFPDLFDHLLRYFLVEGLGL